MGPLSYMRSVVDRNVVMRSIFLIEMLIGLGICGMESNVFLFRWEPLSQYP